MDCLSIDQKGNVVIFLPLSTPGCHQPPPADPAPSLQTGCCCPQGNLSKPQHWCNPPLCAEGKKKKHSASSHTMKNMLKDLNHSPTYQHRKERELFPVSFVINLLWTIWGHSPKKGAEVLFTCCTWQPSALSLITGQTSRAHRCCCVLLGRAFNPNWRSQLGQKNTRKPTQQPN